MKQNALDAVAVINNFITESSNTRENLRWRDQSIIPAPENETVEVCCYIQDDKGIAQKRGFLQGSVLDRLEGNVYWRPETPAPPIPESFRIENIKEPSKKKKLMTGWCDASEKAGMTGIGLVLKVKDAIVHESFNLYPEINSTDSTAAELKGMLLLIRTAKNHGASHLNLYNDNKPAVVLINNVLSGKWEWNSGGNAKIKDLAKEILKEAENIVINIQSIERGNNKIADRLSKKVWENFVVLGGLDSILSEDLKVFSNPTKISVSKINQDGSAVIPKEIMTGLGAQPDDTLLFRFCDKSQNKVFLTVRKQISE